jgi:hypothetical protein
MTPQKSRLQFGLGSLLWLMLLAAVLIGWYVDRTRLKSERDEAQYLVDHADHAIVGYYYSDLSQIPELPPATQP